jgi:hypothetical protein
MADDLVVPGVGGELVSDDSGSGAPNGGSL